MRFSIRQSHDDQRLGGSRRIDRDALLVPAGLHLKAIAAGFSGPCLVTAAAAGTPLFVLERGQGDVSPLRLFRVHEPSGTATLLTTFDHAFGPPLAMSCAQDAVYVAFPRVICRVDQVDGAAAFLSVDAPTLAPAADPQRYLNQPSILPGWAVPGPVFYFCEHGATEAKPGGSVLWRLSAAAPAVPSENVTRPVLHTAVTYAHRACRTPWVWFAGAGVVALGVTMVAFYRGHRRQ